MEFDENPRFWYPRVALNALINFSSRTVELQPSECRKNLPFCFSLSLPIRLLLSLLFIFLLSCFSLSPEFLAFHFVCSYYHFPFSSSPYFHFLFFFHFFFSSFFFSLPFSLFSSFLIFFYFLLSGLIKMGETFPHFPHMSLVFFTQFPYFLIYFSFPLLHH